MAKALRDAVASGIGVVKVNSAGEASHVQLQDFLRNVNRTATRALDEAGVPDKFQGRTDDWEDDF